MFQESSSKESKEVLLYWQFFDVLGKLRNKINIFSPVLKPRDSLDYNWLEEARELERVMNKRFSELEETGRELNEGDKKLMREAEELIKDKP